jgi:tetratricopeptide (TPR) repeat protein
MGRRVGWLLVAWVCLGCTALQTLPEERRTAKDTPAAPAPVEESLRQATSCLESGDDAGALPHLQAYLTAHPDHAVLRAHLGELLLRLHKKGEAQQEFERYLADAANQDDPVCRHVIHSHTRLAEIARDNGNAYEERLHRGIGLYLLARQVAAAPANDENPDTESLLFKAVKQLEQAVKEGPQQARPHWYLYLAWSQLGQMHPAQTNLSQARHLAEQSELPADEFAAMRAAR